LHGGFISTEETIGSPLVGLGVGLEDRRTNGKNEILPENLEADVRSKVSQRTYDPEPGRTVQSMTVDFIFISHLIAPVFFIL
jgi:hypothetical protein